MFDRFKNQDKDITLHLPLVIKVLFLILLALIAYHTSFLKTISKELEESNQNSEITVNVNTSDGSSQALSQTTTQKKTTSQPATTVPRQSPPVQIETPASQTSTPKTEPTTSPQKKPTQPEDNPNPTTHKVEMLNNSPDGAMVFKPAYIQIKSGDSIEFSPTSYGHNVQTPEDIIGNDQAIPKGAKPFKGAMNEKLIVKFTQPGVYLYICNYHYIVGHVGVIQVGNDSHNLDTVKEAGEALKNKIFSHPERVDNYLNMVKVF